MTATGAATRYLGRRTRHARGTVPRGRERAAIAAFSAVGAAGGALGTFLGGALTSALNRHWIFLINQPLGMAALIAAVRVLKNDRGAGLGKGADYPGAVLITGALMLGVYTVVKAADHGWSSAPTLGLGALSVLLLAAFAVRQSRAANPLPRLRLFRSRTLSGANAVQILMIAGMFGFQYIGALYLQQVLGYDELLTGIAFLPAPVVIGVLMLGISARLGSCFGPRPVLLSGLAMSDARPEDAGVASGLFNTTQVMGGALGLAVSRDHYFPPSPTDRRRMIELLAAEPGLTTEEIGERMRGAGWVLTHLRQRKRSTTTDAGTRPDSTRMRLRPVEPAGPTPLGGVIRRQRTLGPSDDLLRLGPVHC